jgi:hypothetical protein
MIEISMISMMMISDDDVYVGITMMKKIILMIEMVMNDDD